MRAIIGIEIGLIHQRQYFAGFCIEHHQRATFGFVGFNSSLQFTVRQILKALVDRELERFTFAWRFQIFNVFNNTALAILDHALLSGGTGEHGLLRKLDTFLPLIIETGEADNVRGYITRRIEATKFALLKHTRDF